MKAKGQRLVTSYFIITIFLLVISFVYKVDLLKKNDKKLPKIAENKTVVTVFTRNSAYSSRLKKDIEKFNLENNKIYIDYKSFDDDYSNILRLSLQSSGRPDIFQLGFYDVIEKEEIYTMEDLNINNFDEIDKSRIFMYKGKNIGLKVSGATVKFVWNKDIFIKSGLNPDNPPETWQELLYYAKKIKQSNPQIVPFEFPASNFGEIKMSIGEPSVFKGDIYTTFWNYKKGEYNFNYSKDIITKYNQLYSDNLIPQDFDKKSIKDIRNDFIEGKTAMMISTSDDKAYFEDNKIDMNIGISNLPRFFGEGSRKYYLTNFNVLVVYKNDNDLNSVISVYKYLYDEYKKLNDESVKQTNLKYAEYDNMKYFDFEGNDPTGSLNINFPKVNSLIYDGIKGKMKIDEVIQNLNSYFNYMKDAKIKKEPDFLIDYIR
ncbi:carbohydrate ABC transporter substrate-binding protein [Caloramator sp. E03]|uniref:ABC transporter substrate-binding protein n=1 Tax=Caloramator sp. E03 TaxID=2576307 RepID=UPI0011106A8F|nr:ABC transporter substrate-binding protein [Caloramator sp. E03]QCX32830.1 carbohydrate ABC transporter substrate-binding protein [Caloramator sp. E03]